MEDNEKVTYIGETDSRNRKLRFGIKKIDRSRHMYTIGKTGMGKSTLLENMAVQDIQNGDGLCFIDPHGKSADLLLEYVPKERIKDVIYFAPFDMDYPISFNVMEDVGPEKRYLVASGMMAAFKKIWVDAWSARMEYILGNIMLALLEYPGSTLVGVNRMLTDKDFRKEVVSHISDPSVKSFWVNEYANYTDKFAAEAAPAIQNKVGQFVANPLIRNIIGQAKSSFDIREVMDNKKILIINLSKGRVGEANANLLGSMLITKIYLGAMSRADLSEKQLAAAPNFYMYVDEFQSFANESFADILSEARKYKLNLSIAHQYIEQMTEEVRAAVFGNVGTMCIFRVGAYDAEVLEKEFTPTFLAEDIVGLQKYQMYLKLMIDGVTSPPFSASGLAPIPKPEISYVQEILDSSRSLYARPRQETEEELLLWIQKNFAVKSGGSAGTSGSGQSGSASPASSGAGSSASRVSGGSQGGDQRSASRQSYGPSGNGPGGQGSQGSGTRGSERSSDRGGSAPRSGGVSENRGDRVSSPYPQSQPRVPASAPLEQRSPGPAGAVALQGERRMPDDRYRQASSGQQRPPSDAASDRAAQVQQPSRSLPENRLAPSPNARTDGGRPMTQGEKQEASTTRETELRKAMSLSYLKAEPEKKESKAPKPENVAALREALLAVMGTSTLPPAMEAAAEGLSNEAREGENEAPIKRIEDVKPADIRQPLSESQQASRPVEPERQSVFQDRAREIPQALQQRPASENEKRNDDNGRNDGNKRQDGARQGGRPEAGQVQQHQASRAPEIPRKDGGEVSEELLKGIFDES